MITTAKAINGEIRRYDWVISVPSDEYGGLVGMVSEIRPLDSPDHDTDNETDDVYINFTAMDYSDKRKDEIAEQISQLYSESRPFDELMLDEVIMSPDSLIRITDIELSVLDSLLDSQEAAESFCNQILAGRGM
jgi:hypothetical protein